MKFIDKVKFWIKEIYINLEIKFGTKKTQTKDEEFFYVFLDLLSFRCTWDIVGFLILAKINSGDKKVKIVVLPEINLRFDNSPPKEKSWLKNSSKKIRFDNIIKPCFEIVENLNPIIILLNDRKDANDYINNAKYKFPEYSKPNKVIEWDYEIYKKINNNFNLFKTTPSLKAPIQYESIVDEYIKENSKGKKIVTITLRDSSFNESKNSNLKEWLKVYEKLNKDGFCVIFLDDFENVSINCHKSELIKKNIYHYANIDLRVRLALYERAFVNLTVSNGTAQLLNYSKYTSFLMFKHYIDDVTSSTSLENNLKINGLDGKKNEQYPFHNKCQKIVWDPIDSYETIINEFEKIKTDLVN